MRKGFVALAAIALLVVAAVAAVPVVERHAAEQVKREVERNGSAVDEVSVGLFDRRIRLLNLKTEEVSVGRWEASGLAWPIGELLAGRTPLAGFRWGDPFSADRVELENVKVPDRASGSSSSMDALLIDGLSLRRYDARYDGGFPFAVLTARAMGALAVRRLEQRNLRVTLAGTGETVGAASIVVEGYDRGRIASLVIAGLEAAAAQGEPAQVSIADMKASDMDLGRMIAAISSDQWYPGGPTGRVHVDKASVTGFGGELLKRYGISLAGASFETVRESDTVSRSRTRVEGLVLSPALRGLEGLSLRLALQAMGLKEITAELDCSGTEDRGKGEMVIDRCVLTAPGLAEIDFTARIVDADRAFWNAVDDGDALALLDSSASLGAARLVVADKSLLERGLRAAAAMTGQPAAATRAAWAREVRRYQPTGVLISQSMTQLLDTVARFIEQGGTLTIDAAPEPPLGFDRFEYLASPGADLVNVLGLRATLSK